MEYSTVALPDVQDRPVLTAARYDRSTRYPDRFAPPDELGAILEAAEPSVTEARGLSATGTPPTLPAVFTTLPETQQRRPELCGSMIFHQVPSALLPVICAL